MKLKTQAHDIEINSFTKNGGLTLYVPTDTNLGELRTAVQTSGELEFYVYNEETKEETLSAVLTGKFTFDEVAVEDRHIKVVFSRQEDEIAKLGDAITNLELALCEIYENMEV